MLWFISCRRLRRWRFLDGRVDVGEHLGNVCFMKVGTDAAEERDTILRTKFLVDRLEMPLASQGGCLTLSASQFILSHGCSQSLSASGRCSGSLWKHCCRKSWSASEQSSGRGGISSSTIRNITVKSNQSHLGINTWNDTHPSWCSQSPRREDGR